MSPAAFFTVRPEELPMSPPQSLPPSPPAFARSYGLRTTHVFPSTPGASMDELSSLDKEEKEIPFRFPVPKGHLCAPSGVSLDLASEHGSIATIDENLLAFDLQRNPLASCGRKGVFHRAFLPNNVPSSSIPIFVASSTHGRSSSISALCKSPDADLITGWQTPSPSESLLGLSNLTELLFTSDKASRNQGENTSSCAVDAAPWVHRRALLPTVSRRGKRMLALACLVVFILIFTKLSRTNENSTLSMISQTPPTLVTRKGFHDFAARPMTGPSAALGTGWVWHEGEELAALIGFLTSEDSHAIPPMADGTTIDPELVLDFDPLHSTDLAGDMREMIAHVWQERPIILLGKSHGDPRTRDVKNTLLGLRTRPAPSVLLVDTRADAYQIVPVFERLTKTPLDHFPILLIGGRPIDPSRWHQAELQRLVVEAGATVIPPKIKRPVPVNPNHKG